MKFQRIHGLDLPHLIGPKEVITRRCGGERYNHLKVAALAKSTGVPEYETPVGHRM
jgi:hypothetical protein